MFTKVSLIILVYFLAGALALMRIGTKLDSGTKKKQWTKYFVYLLIVSGIVSLIHFTGLFTTLSLIILCIGFVEIIRLVFARKSDHIVRGLIILLLYAASCFGFYLFSKSVPSILLFVYALVFTFDGFSQITGQLFGRTKLAPKTSPNKTIEGTIGGAIITLITAFILHGNESTSIVQTLVLAVFIILSSLTGDLLASALKRLYHVKDFSHLIPGHGGILDRFDSFILAGSVYYLFTIFNFVI